MFGLAQMYSRDVDQFAKLRIESRMSPNGGKVPDQIFGFDAGFSHNREINRQFSAFLPKIPELCPDSAILLPGTGNNREFPVSSPSHSISTA